MQLLTLQEVAKTYIRGSRELTVLRDVSLELNPGDFVAVFGQRSAGKTTLMKIAAGLETPDSGIVLFEGRDLACLSATQLAHVHRNEVAWVDRSGPQGDELMMADYVALPLLGRYDHKHAKLVAAAALDRVGAKDCADAQWRDLADAERMHVALAHGLVREPRLLVLDDPTAGLDVIDRERIVRLLRAIADEARVGVLMAVPDMPAMLRSHDMYTLSGGQLLGVPDPPPGGGTIIDFPGQERSA